MYSEEERELTHEGGAVDGAGIWSHTNGCVGRHLYCIRCAGNKPHQGDGG